MDTKNYEISVCIIARPKENLDKCIWSLKRQTYPSKEIVVHREIGMYSKLRNKVIDKSSGEIIAFIDADCYAEKHWLEEMNNVFQDKSIVGVWGKTSYELFGKQPTIATRIVNNDGQGVSTSNAGFRADILKKVRFDEEINSNEDWVINNRMKKVGKVIYNNDMVIFHTYQKWTFKGAIKHAKKVEDRLKARMKYNMFPEDSFLSFIIYPKQYLIIFFPFLLFITHSVRSWYDLKIVLGNYIEKIYTRFLIWRFAIKNKVFFI